MPSAAGKDTNDSDNTEPKQWVEDCGHFPLFIVIWPTMLNLMLSPLTFWYEKLTHNTVKNLRVLSLHH